MEEPIYVAEIIDISNEFFENPIYNDIDGTGLEGSAGFDRIATDRSKGYFPSDRVNNVDGGIADYAKMLEKSVAGFTMPERISSKMPITANQQNNSKESFSEKMYREGLSSKISDIKSGNQAGYSTKSSSDKATYSSGNFSASRYEGALLSKLQKSGSTPTASDFNDSASAIKNKNSGSDRALQNINPEITNIASISQNTYIPSAYIAQIKTKIYENWEKPSSVLPKNAKAIVSFKINKNGVASDIIIEKTSGSADFDNSVVNAIKKSSPFLSFPLDVTLNIIEVSAEFSARGIQ